MVRNRDSSSRCSSLTELNGVARGSAFPFASGRALADALGGSGTFRGVVDGGAPLGDVFFLEADFTGLDEMVRSFCSKMQEKHGECGLSLQGRRLRPAPASPLNLETEPHSRTL